MNTWEYRVVDGHGNCDRVESTCNELGTQGWELVGTTPILAQYDPRAFGETATRTDWLMIFKRAAQQSTARGE
jgi:hypothetical protein